MDNSIVVSTRIRLSRNLKGYPFPSRLDSKRKNEIVQKVYNALKEGNSAISSDFQLIKVGELTRAQGLSFVEKHLISPEFINGDKEGRALVLKDDKKVSIMINEEDHVRIQIITDGLNLEGAYDLADKIDTLLDENLDFAFDEKLGYLTQCPTNLGTGMRASVMLHLPALQKTGALSRIGGNLSKLGLTIRGIYGEGTEPKGAMYQLSNQVTLGISESAAIENLKNITDQLASQEVKARETIMKSVSMRDTVHRSLGILKYALAVSHDEAMELLSNVRMGVVSGEITGITCETIDKLIPEIQPATMIVTAGENLDPEKRDILRAKTIRERLGA